MSKRTKKQIIDDLCESEAQLDWLEGSCIPRLKEELSKFKLTKAEIYKFSLEEFVNKTK